MEYEFKELEHIISIVLNTKRILRENLNDEFIAEFKLHAENEKERIRKQFRLMVFGERQQSVLESYYRKHQTILIELADMAFGYLQSEERESIYRLTNEGPILNVYKEILGIPEELLDFMEKSFPEYFDHNLKVPEVKRLQLVPEIKRNLKGVQKELLNGEVHMEFIKIVCRPFDDYLLTGALINYRDFYYLQELQRELILFKKKQHDGNVNEELCRLLLHLNFNSIHFFTYYIAQLQENAKGCNANLELIAHYSLKLKIINQLPVKSGLIHKPDLPPVREQIGSWICEELYFLEKKERLLIHEPLQKNELHAREMKVHTS